MQLKTEEIKNFLIKEKNENNNTNTNINNNNDNNNSTTKNNINEEVIYNIGQIKNENEELKIKNENLSKENDEFSKKFRNLQEKIQELNFAKSTLTKMLVEKDNTINEMSLRQKENEKNLEKINNDKTLLEKLINNMEIKQKEDEEKRKKEEEEKKRKEEENILNINTEKNMKKDYKIKIQILEYANKDLTQKLANADNQIDILEKSLETISQKNTKIEKLYKENISQNNIFLNEVKTLKMECDNQNIAFNRLKLTNEKNINIINELNTKLHEYEKENLKLISKLNKQIFEKDYVENNLVKQNNQILLYNKEQEEKINKLITENNILNQEKEQYKKLFEQIYNHSNNLIKEKNISIIRQQIKDIKNISNSICSNNKNGIFNYDYCIENNSCENNFNIIENSEIINEKKNNGAQTYDDIKDKRIMIDNTKDNSNDNKSLTPIHKDNNNSFITCSIEENNLQNKSYFVENSGNRVKPDKILEMIRKERIKKQKLDEQLKKIET